MEIPEKLTKLKFHFMFGVALLVFSPIYLSPKVIEVAAFFGPLFLSTALFLLAVLVFGRTLPLAADAPGEKAAEVILDLVTGEPVEVQLQQTDEEKEEEEEVLVKKEQIEEEAQAKEAKSFEPEQKM